MSAIISSNSRMIRIRSVYAMLSLFVVACVLSGTGVAHAATTQELAVTPVVIDQKGQARDIIELSVTLKNISNRKLTLYPSVNDVHPETGEQTFISAQNADDLEASLARWMELSRGVIDMGPGEEKIVPFVIRINQNAAPGLYHAIISFSNGSNRGAAEAAGDLATATVNLEVQADIKEIMQLNKFTTDNVVFSGDDVLFNYQLQNIGNQDLRPKGEIRIYDRKGQEIASVEVNGDGKSVSPDQIAQLASVWNGAEGFGRFKAMLTVDYGTAQTASVQDSIFFWVIPWKQLLALTVVTLIAIIVLVLNFHRQIEERHLGKLARAGMLKAPETALAAPVPVPAPVHAPAPPNAYIPPPAHAAPYEAPRTRGVLGFLRRGSPPMVEPAVGHMPPVQKAPIAQVLPVSQRDHASVSAFTSRATGGTIDLKSMPTSDAPPAIPRAHVIDLKSGS